MVLHGGSMAASVTTVPLAVYLETTYRPDRDWVDGELRERNLGEEPHATVQVFLSFVFRSKGALWGVRALSEQRVQTSPDHYRVADFCVVRRGIGQEPIVRTPPLLCVEILSRDDRMREIQDRVVDYLTMGVEAVWVIDPLRRRAFSATRDGSLQFEGERLEVSGTQIVIPVVEIFAELDDLDEIG